MADQQAITCKQCGKVGTLAEFFTYKTKTGIKPLTKCRKCHNVGKYTKKPTGWAKLDKEIQGEIRKQLEQGDKLPGIAADFDLSYANLKRWVYRGDHLAE